MQYAWLQFLILCLLFLYSVQYFQWVLHFFVSAACFAIGVIITLGNCKTYKEVSGGKNVPGSVGALVALAVSTLDSAY